MLKIEHLSKSYKKKKVLDDISYEFGNMIYVLLGENGAGKTTLLRCITGVIKRYSGSIDTDEKGTGKEAAQIRRSRKGMVINSKKDDKIRIGYMPQNFGTYYNLTVKETLEYISILKEIGNMEEAVDRSLKMVHLEDIKDEKVKTLSGGMIRRLGIAQAILDEPDILIMDEPTVGLDPKERRDFFERLQELDFSGTILISTHILDDVSKIADKALILINGKVMELQWKKGDADLEDKYLCLLEEI